MNTDEEIKNNVIPMPQKARERIALLGGEGEVTGYIFKPRHNILGKGWIAMFQEAFLWLAEGILTGEQSRVFYYLLGRLDFDNYLRVSLKEIAEGTHLNIPNVSRAMKHLQELDIICKGPKAGYFNTYRLNPYMGHKGTKNYKSNVVEWDEMKSRQKRKKQQEEESKK